MRNNSRLSTIRALFGLLIALALVAAACGDSTDTTATGDTGATATTAPPSTGGGTAATTPPSTDGATPTTAAPTPPSEPTKFVLLLPALRGEDWLCPNCSLGAILNLQPMFEPLIYHDIVTGEIVTTEGRLAETWTVNSDFTEYTFKLREGVQFHDGWGEVTTDDIVFSHSLATREGTTNPSGERLGVMTPEVIDKYNIVFKSDTPMPQVNLFSEMSLSFPITSRAYVEGVGEAAAALHPIGQGPYQFLEHIPGVSVSFAAVKDHYRAPPAIDVAEIRAVAEFNTRLALMEAGEADLMVVAFDQVPAAEAAGLATQGLSLQSNPTIYLPAYVDPQGAAAADPPPWDHNAFGESAVLVREALSKFINRNEIVEFVLSGLGTVDGACVHSWWPYHAGYDASCTVDTYDPDGATALLAQAGFASPGDLSVTIDLAEHPGRPWCGQVASAVAQQWTNAGIDVTTQFGEYSVVVEAATSAREANYAFCYPPPTWPSAVQLWGFYSRTTDRLSYSGESAELDQLINDGLAAEGGTDAEKEAAAAALFDFAVDNRPGLSIAYADLVYAKNACLDWPSLPGTVAFYVHNYEFMSYTC